MQSVEDVLLASGRRVAVHALAGGDGPTVVLCHPSPGSGVFDPAPSQTRSRNITLWAVDRPGYGRSEPIPPGTWATVAGAADDLAEVLDRRGVTKVGLAGWGEGGWTALALAAHRPQLVDRLVLIATPAPDADLPWLPADRRTLIASLRGTAPETAHAELATAFAADAALDPHAEDALRVLHRTDADDDVLATPGARERLADMLASAYAQNTNGIATDVAGSMLQPWGFKPAAVAAKTLLLFGQHDPIAPSRHATWWLRNLQQARVETSPRTGHLHILNMWGRALSHLAPGSKV